MSADQGEAALIGQILTASMGATFDTMDRLYEIERRRRMALEVHIWQALDRFEEISGGTVREYERVIRELRFIPVDTPDEMIAQHPEARLS